MSLESKSNWILPEKVLQGDIVEYLLKTRGIEGSDEFLNPKLSSIPDFNTLFDTKSAAKQIVDGVKSGKKIVIHGDFDADGICSVSLLWEFLFKDLSRHLNTSVDVIPYIPSRVEQGYGLTESSIKDLIDLGAQLVVTVDCGVRDKPLIKSFVSENGLQFVITDHHQPPQDILDDLDYTLVHPMYPSKEYAYQSVCGAYVTFLLIQAIKKEVGMEYEIEKDTKGLDLVAMATVTDLMPLLDVNRVVVKYGIDQMRSRSRLGINELVKAAGIESNDIDSYHLGYVLGPRINAAGRIGSPLDAVKMLVSEKEDVCRSIAKILNETNYQRQYMTQNCMDEAEQLIEDSSNKLIFVLGEDWHEGIVGLVAGKLNEKYCRPVLVATKSKDGVRGSARSIEGFDITKALGKCSEYLERYGGHEQAAGFTVKEGMVKKFSECIHMISEESITDDMLIKDLRVDLLLSSDSMTISLLEQLDRLKPYGYGNSKPVVGITDLIVFKKQIMGKLGNHMKLVCKGDGVDLITLVLFNCTQDTERINIDDVIDVVGSMGVNSWNGREEIQFLVKEWRYKV